MTASLPLSLAAACVFAYAVWATPPETYAACLPVVILWREDGHASDPDGNGQAGAQYPWHEVEPSAGSWTAERLAPTPAKRPYAPDRAPDRAAVRGCPDYTAGLYAPEAP